MVDESTLPTGFKDVERRLLPLKDQLAMPILHRSELQLELNWPNRWLIERTYVKGYFAKILSIIVSFSFGVVMKRRQIHFWHKSVIYFVEQLVLIVHFVVTARLTSFVVYSKWLLSAHTFTLKLVFCHISLPGYNKIIKAVPNANNQKGPFVN